MTEPRPAGCRIAPTLDGLEDKWASRWEEDGVYVRRSVAERANVYAIDTPPPTVSGELHMGHVLSYTHTDTIARFQRNARQDRLLPDGVGRQRAAHRAPVQNVFGVRCDPALPYDPQWQPPSSPPKPPWRSPAQLRRGSAGG